MNTKEKVGWFNARDPLHKWKVGQDVYCLHCDAVFKAEDVGVDAENDPECPLCQATPLDLHPIPWWREDLVGERSDVERWLWLVVPIQATPGRPGKLPSSDWQKRN